MDKRTDKGANKLKIWRMSDSTNYSQELLKAKTQCYINMFKAKTGNKSLCL